MIDDARAPRLLGAHVAERAQQVAGQGQAAVVLDRARPKSAIQRLPRVDHQVRGLDVAVDDAVGARVERLGRLKAEERDALEEARDSGGVTGLGEWRVDRCELRLESLRVASCEWRGINREFRVASCEWRGINRELRVMGCEWRGISGRCDDVRGRRPAFVLTRQRQQCCFSGLQLPLDTGHWQRTTVIIPPSLTTGH